MSSEIWDPKVKLLYVLMNAFLSNLLQRKNKNLLSFKNSAKEGWKLYRNSTGKLRLNYLILIYDTDIYYSARAYVNLALPFLRRIKESAPKTIPEESASSTYFQYPDCDFNLPLMPEHMFNKLCKKVTFLLLSSLDL